MSSFPHLITSLLGLLLPDRCVACRHVGELICARCCTKLVPYHGRLRSLPGLSHVQIAYVYQSPLREAIHQLKYRRRHRVAQPLGALLAAQTATYAPECVIMPIPMHAARRAERGFNQAELLAEVVASSHGARCDSQHLLRVRATGQQAHLNAAEREANMQNAFAWNTNVPVPEQVLLVDDVLTTGATMHACAIALRAAGCKQVFGLALARSRPDLA